MIRCSRWFCFYIVSLHLFCLPSLYAQTDIAPREIIFQSWRIHSFLQEGNLENQYLMFIDFDKEGNAWIATSNGLVKYDGYTWKRFSTQAGLPSSFVRCILFARNGLMWIGTDKGAGVFDGVSFQTMGSDTGLSGQCVRRIREDAEGTIWFCCDRWPINNDPGGLTSYKDGIWTTYDTQDGLPSNNVNDFFEDTQGRQFVLTLHGLAQREGKRWIRPLEDQKFYGADDLFWSIAESPKYGVIATTGSSIFVLKDNVWSRYVSRFPRQFKLCQTHDGNLLSCSDMGGQQHRFLQWEGEDFRPISAGFKSPYREIGEIREAPDGSIWCVGFDCLIRWQRSGGEITVYGNLPPPRVVDNQNRIWLSNAQKTIRLNGSQWESIDTPHRSLGKDKEGNVWGWSNHGITQWKADNLIHHATSDTHLFTPIGFNNESSGKLYFYGKNQEQQNLISIYDGSKWTPREIPELQTGTIAGSTSDPHQGIWYLLSNPSENQFQLFHIDDRSVEILSVDPRITPPFPTFLRADYDDHLWLYGHFGLYQLDRNHPSSWKSISQVQGKNVTTSAIQNHDLWFGITALLGGQGEIFHYSNGSFTSFISKPQEFSVTADDGTIFFAGDECLYQIFDRTQNAPVRLSLPDSGLIIGIVKDQQSNIWIGMQNSVFRYQSDRIPPDTQIIASATEVLSGGTLGIQFRGIERFGTSQIDKDFRFSWHIDSEPWSEFQNLPPRGISSSNLTIGIHRLFVRAQDEGMDIDPSPAVMEFSILPTPLQKRLWFLPIVGALTLLILILVVYTFITKHKLGIYAHTLENLVHERTISLQEREATLQSVYRSAPVGIGMTNNRILSWINDKLCETTGYSSEELIGKNTRVLYPNDMEYERIGSIAYEGMRKYGIFSIETRWRHKEGQIIEILLNLTPTDPLDLQKGVTFTSLDITEKKQSAQKLEDSERIYREAIEVAGAVPYYQNYLTNNYDFVGPGIQELLGISPEKFTPPFWTSLVQEYILLGNLQGLSEKEAIQKARGEEGVSWRADFRILLPSGKERWIANAAVQVRNEENRVIGSLGTLQDITERKQLEEHLLQAQKMEAVGQLAGGIAHNINNLLTGIIGNQSLALLKATDDIKTYLTNANYAANRAADLVKALLIFSRKTRIELKPTNFNLEIEEVFRLIRVTFDRRIDILLQLEDPLPLVMADSAQIHSILMNLCINARDAIENILQNRVFEHRQNDIFQIILQSETLWIDTYDTKFNSNLPPGKYVMISVSDNGTGIDEETQKHIFEPFFTTKETVGTGLGLASAFGIIKQHNGWIDFNSEYGYGTTFRIFFPIVSTLNQDLAIDPPPHQNVSGNETILLADDEEFILKLGTEILSQKGYSIIQAQDGEECINRFQENRDRIKLIILDLSMPKLSGKEVMRQILALSPAAKILISSGHSSGQDSESLKHLGALGILAKPYNPLDLLQKVRNILDQ